MALGAFLLLGCNQLFYVPSKQTFYSPTGPHRPKDIFFQSGDETLLHAWLFSAQNTKNPKATIVHFHGNAENLTTHFMSVDWLAAYGYEVFCFDYRGYGRSQGRAESSGIRKDGLAALEKALSLDDEGTRPLIVYGQSLGGAIAVRALGDLKDRSRVAAVIVEASFHSYQAMAREALKSTIVLWPFQWLAYLLISDKDSPEKIIPTLSPIPLLVVHGDRDSVVPKRLGEKFFKLAKEPKSFWSIAGGDHLNLFDRKDTRNRLLAFLAGC